MGGPARRRPRPGHPAGRPDRTDRRVAARAGTRAGRVDHPDRDRHPAQDRDGRGGRGDGVRAIPPAGRSGARLAQRPPVHPRRRRLRRRRSRAMSRRPRRRRHKRLAAAVAARKAGEDGGADELFHSARKAGKRHRYAVEAAMPLWGAKAEKVVAARKDLQDVLGAHQDRAVSAGFLRDLGARIGVRCGSTASPTACCTPGWWLPATPWSPTSGRISDLRLAPGALIRRRRPLGNRWSSTGTGLSVARFPHRSSDRRRAYPTLAASRRDRRARHGRMGPARRS